MTKHKPIAMRCTQTQFDEIKPILEAEGKLIYEISDFTDDKYLVSNYLGGNRITNLRSQNNHNRDVFEQWDASKFLEYCNINPLKYLKPMTKQVTLSEELAKQMIASGNEELKAFALENYPNLQKSKYPMKWEELGDYICDCYLCDENKIHQIKDIDFIRNIPVNHYIYPTEELAKAAKVLPILLQLRNAWWKADGWDIETASSWYTIHNTTNDGLIVDGWFVYTTGIFSFKDRETAQLFLDTFRDELEIAKPLL